MANKRPNPEEIVAKLRQVEVLMRQGMPRIDAIRLKWSGKIGQRAKVYPTRMNGYENDEATELFR